MLKRLVLPVTEHGKVLVQLLCCDHGVDLGRDYVRVHQNTARAFNQRPHTLVKCRKSMSGCMETNVLRYFALFHHLFQLFADWPVVEAGEYEIILQIEAERSFSAKEYPSITLRTAFSYSAISKISSSLHLFTRCCHRSVL